MNTFEYTPQAVKLINPRFFAVAKENTDLDQMRKKLATHLYIIELESSEAYDQDAAIFARIRDISQVLRNMLKKRSEDLARFSMAQAIYDIAHENPRLDLTPAFYADLYHLLLGIQGKGSRKAFDDIHLSAINDQGRPAAIHRSRQLDEIRTEVDQKISQYKTGLDTRSIVRRNKRRDKIITRLNASLDDWQNWHWQIKNIIKDPEILQKLVKLSREEKRRLKRPGHITFHLELHPIISHSWMTTRTGVIFQSEPKFYLPPIMWPKSFPIKRNLDLILWGRKIRRLSTSLPDDTRQSVYSNLSTPVHRSVFTVSATGKLMMPCPLKLLRACSRSMQVSNGSKNIRPYTRFS